MATALSRISALCLSALLTIGNCRNLLPQNITFAGLALLRAANGDITPSHIGDLERLNEADRLLEKAASLHRHAQVKTVRNKIAMRLRALEAYGSQGDLPEQMT